MRRRRLLLRLEEGNAVVVADQDVVHMPGGLHLLVLLSDLIEDRRLASKFTIPHLTVEYAVVGIPFFD